MFSAACLNAVALKKIDVMMIKNRNIFFYSTFNMEEHTMQHLTFLSAVFILTSFFTIASASDIKENSAELVIHIQGIHNYQYY